MHTNNVAVFRGMTEAEVTRAYDVMKPEVFAWLTKNREEALVVEKRLKPIKDVSYGSDERQKLDIYAPQDAKGLPVLIDIHGGGWCMGSKEPRAIPAEPVMKHGMVWVSINYGFAPKHTLDAIIDHVRQAIGWLYRNIASYGGDPERMYSTGNSAGAHLAATALMPGWHDAHKVPHDVIKGAICVSGVYDMQSICFANIESKEALKLSLDDAKRGSPLYHLPNHAPKVILAYGQNEPPGYSLEAKAYAKALASAGKEAKVIEVANVDHFPIMNEFLNVEGELFKALLIMIKG